ncbi:unnamed protein product [Brugia timori]|uniref:DUF3347 domain-containing protein n=1 Tax=Brugia timori TaxID=42155 RepID=A0A0R3QK94_9BILA|nr:unnamed protein product [Brugia timori]
MTADDEVRNIHWTLGKIHQALHQTDKEFEKALPQVNYLSAKLEQIITDIANETNNIRNVIVMTVSNKYDTKALIYYSPLFTSAGMPYNKNEKECWIDMHNLDNQRLLQREKV